MHTVDLKSTEDLKKILFLQKTISSQAKNELQAVASDRLLEGIDEDNEEEVARQAHLFMQEQSNLIEKYAKYPTLTEFKLQPSVYSGSKWGATFGVTLLVGECIFELLKRAHPQFEKVVRSLFILFLDELEDPKHAYLIEPLEKHLKFNVTTEEGHEVSKKEQRNYVRKLLTSLVESMFAISESYGIVNINDKDGEVSVTPVGKRILLHLLDASKFVEEMTVAHSKFQNEKPKLSMAG